MREIVKLGHLKPLTVLVFGVLNQLKRLPGILTILIDFLIMDMQQFVRHRIKTLKLKLHAKNQSKSSMAWVDQQIISSEISALQKLQKEFNNHQKSFG